MEQLVIPLLGNAENDFWEQNPELNYIPEIRVAKNEYGIAQASKYAWAIVLMSHPKSKLSRLDNKVEIIAQQYLQIPEEEFASLLDDNDFLTFADIIKSVSMSALEYEMSLNIDAIKKARNLVFNSTDAKAITAYLEKTPKIMKELIALQSEVNKSSDDSIRVKRTAKNYNVTTFQKEITKDNQMTIDDDE